MDTTASFIKEYNSYRNELRKPYLPDARLTDSLVRLTYERLKEEVNAYHILSLSSLMIHRGYAESLQPRLLRSGTEILAGEDFATAADSVFGRSFGENKSGKSRILHRYANGLSI